MSLLLLILALSGVSAAKGVPASACPTQVSVRHTAAVYLVRGGSKELDWLCYSTRVCSPARAGCTVYQADLFTLREKEAKCLTTSLRGQYNSLPVVFQSYSSEGVLTRRSLLVMVMVLRATCSIKVKQWLTGCRSACVCVLAYHGDWMRAVKWLCPQLSKSGCLSIINIIAVLVNLSLS